MKMFYTEKGAVRFMYYANELIEKLKNSHQVVIFGARLIAFQVANCLMSRPYQLQIDYCLVSDLEENKKCLMGIPVIALKDAKRCIDENAIILIATSEKYRNSIESSLRKFGYSHMISMTFESDLWSEIQGNYYKAHWLMRDKTYLTMEEELESTHQKNKSVHPLVHIYSVKSHVDKQLGEECSRFEWEIPIQAGAALTKQKICEVRDDFGDNISHKNSQYCELTALYWIWKNDKSDYVGLCHYRRHFELEREDLSKLASSDIDVVLTIPILNFPSVWEVYRHDHAEHDWEIMLEAIRKIAPKYLATAIELQNGNFYYGYNMLITRKEILNDYCAWLFPILFYCEEHCEKKHDAYQNRYIGFLAERLLSIYFIHHEDDFKIVHVRKHFIE